MVMKPSARHQNRIELLQGYARPPHPADAPVGPAARLRHLAGDPRQLDGRVPGRHRGRSYPALPPPREAEADRRGVEDVGEPAASSYRCLLALTKKGRDELASGRSRLGALYSSKPWAQGHPLSGGGRAIRAPGSALQNNGRECKKQSRKRIMKPGRGSRFRVFWRCSSSRLPRLPT